MAAATASAGRSGESAELSRPVWIDRAVADPAGNLRRGPGRRGADNWRRPDFRERVNIVCEGL